MSNEVLAIIIAIIIMVPAILFYELIIVRNYADKFLPPTVLSLFFSRHGIFTSPVVGRFGAKRFNSPLNDRPSVLDHNSIIRAAL